MSWITVLQGAMATYKVIGGRGGERERRGGEREGRGVGTDHRLHLLMYVFCFLRCSQQRLMRADHSTTQI